MDLKQVEYIVQIAKENNITRAAEKLFITQSALNQQLLKLEKELGAPLFYRSRTNWRPTEAGEIYISNAMELLRIKKETYNTISDIAQTKRGSLSVGFTPGRGIEMFTKVYPDFHSEYPDIAVTPVEMNVRRQQETIARGDLDIGFLTVCERNRVNLRYINICGEDILLAIPKGHPLARTAAIPFSVADLSDFAADPFVLTDQSSSIRPILERIFAAAGFQPRVLFETSSNAAIVTMIRSGLCCGILPQYYVGDHLDGLACFRLPDQPSWNIVACYRAGSYLSQAAQRFIQLATQYWSRLFPGN